MSTITASLFQRHEHGQPARRGGSMLVRQAMQRPRLERPRVILQRLESPRIAPHGSIDRCGLPDTRPRGPRVDLRSQRGDPGSPNSESPNKPLLPPRSVATSPGRVPSRIRIGSTKTSLRIPTPIHIIGLLPRSNGELWLKPTVNRDSRRRRIRFEQFFRSSLMRREEAMCSTSSVGGLEQLTRLRPLQWQ